ncbi:MAG: glycosyltransferase family 4 protein [Myxococcota bacterium]
MTSLHVGLDAIGAHSGGAEPMLRGILGALGAHPSIHRVTVFCSPTPQRRFELSDLPEHIELMERPAEARSYIRRARWFRAHQPSARSEVRADAYFGFNALGDVRELASVQLLQQGLLCAGDERARLGGARRLRLGLVGALTRSACRSARRVIVPTPWMRAPVASMGVDPGRIEHVTPHAVYHGAPAPRAPQLMEDVPGDRRVLYVGHDLSYKALDVVILAMGLLRRSLPRATLFIAGEVGAGRAREGVVVLGARARSEVRALMEHAALLVHPSRVESLGFSMLEAMSSGLPVLARHVPARPFAREVCGEAARTIDSSDPAAWARVMASCLLDPAARELMAERGRARHHALVQAAPFMRMADLVVECACSS